MRYFATLGPKTHTVQDLIALFQSGMTGVRLNLSHGDLKDHQEWMVAFQQAVQISGMKDVELLVDLNGPEIRIGALAKAIQLEPQTLVTIGVFETISVPQAVFTVLESNDVVLLDDGRIRLRTLKVEKDKALMEVIAGGVLAGHKSLAIENKTVDLPTLSQEDLDNMQVMSNYPITGVMLPFVRERADLLNLRKTLQAYGLDHIKIYAKIENQAGVQKLPQFIDVCDEVVIARGDLGNAMPLWELPATQKRISQLCLKKGKPFMVVTQLLDSMIARPSPTRAEVSDIFNAVLDGAASLMVTGETAIGRYPVAVMTYLVNTSKEALKYLQD